MYIYMYVHFHSHDDWSKLIDISVITFPRNHDDFAKWSEDLAPKNDSPEAAKTLEKTCRAKLATIINYPPIHHR